MKWHLHGRVNERKELELHDKSALDQALDQLRGKRIVIVLKEWRRRRSLDANAYYWYVCTFIANEVGDDPEAVHEGLKHKYLHQGWIRPGIPKVGSTRKLDSKEFAEYVDRILIDAGTGELLGSPLRIPQPNEVEDE